MISENLRAVKADIAKICHKVGSDPRRVTLIGVTKYSSVSDIQEAVLAGLTDIGENRVADAQAKFLEMGDGEPRVRRHLIGHLQSNKARLAVSLFDMIQSVDSVKLIRELQKEALAQNRIPEILLQVNISGETQKFGASPLQVADLLDEIAECSHLRCRGLMTMAPLTGDESAIRACFRGLCQLFDRFLVIYAGHDRVSMRDLSMGMSGDYRIALEEGANMLRIGTAIFRKD